MEPPLGPAIVAYILIQSEHVLIQGDELEMEVCHNGGRSLGLHT
jgi:hypothetical protein